MFTDSFGDIVKNARKALGLTQKELARRAQVSTRLWAEVERGERPNVSLATALRMLGEVGVTVRLTDPHGTSAELRDPATAATGAAARAAVRRATWTGRQIRLAQEGAHDEVAAHGRDRLTAVAMVSEQAFAVARGQARRNRQPANRRPATTHR